MNIPEEGKLEMIEQNESTMKVYITMYYGPFTESSILGVFAKSEDAEQLAEEERQKIQKEWTEFLTNSAMSMTTKFLKEAPHDQTGVVEYEVR